MSKAENHKPADRRLTERQIISRIAMRMPPADPHLLTELEDDAALLHAPPKGTIQAVTTDLLVEGVHFDQALSSLQDIGIKGLFVNLSDIAAMAAIPRFAFGNLGVPMSATASQIEELLDGVFAAAEFGEVSLAGGDTVSAPHWIVGFTVLGECTGKPLRRTGAQPGDVIWHSGSLGLSQVGLHLLWGTRKNQASFHLAEVELAERAFAAHRTPRPQLALGRWLGEAQLATAGMDLSDSLSQCLLQLADASGVGLKLELAGYPFAAELRTFQDELGGAAPAEPFSLPGVLSPNGQGQEYNSLVEFLLASSEDYQLLFTAPEAATDRLLEDCPVALTRLGVVTDAAAGRTYRDLAGIEQPLTQIGWQHR